MTTFDGRGHVKYDVKISKYFKLGELTINTFLTNQILKHTTSLYRAKKTDNKKTVHLSRDQVLSNLEALANNCLDKIVEFCSKQGLNIRINSGLRDSGNSSDHNRGMAVDIQINTGNSFDEVLLVCNFIKANLDFRQCILEKNNTYWIHLAYSQDEGANWNQCLTFYKHKTYSLGFVRV